MIRRTHRPRRSPSSSPTTIAWSEPACELIQAVRMAAQGRTYLNPELGGRLAVEAPDQTRRPDDLSAREVEVLRLIGLGHTNGEIAGQLFLSVRTVESDRAHIQQKTQRTSRSALVAYAREQGLL